MLTFRKIRHVVAPQSPNVECPLIMGSSTIFSRTKTFFFISIRYDYIFLLFVLLVNHFVKIIEQFVEWSFQVNDYIDWKYGIVFCKHLLFLK